MKYFYVIGILTSTLIYICIAAENLPVGDFEKFHLIRSGRTYDKYSKIEKTSYEDKSNYDEDAVDEYLLENNNGQPPQDYSGYSGYDAQQYGFNNKGYSFYQPSFKGGYTFPNGFKQSGPHVWYPNQMLSMMNSLKDKNEEEEGFLSKLVTEKPLAAAAIIPLSIAFAASVPVIMNYVMTILTPQAQPVQITATNKKNARNIDENLENVLGSISKFARDLDIKECFQKSICQVVETDLVGSEYIKKSASAIMHFIKEDWLKEIGAKDYLDCINEGNCDTLCSSTEQDLNTLL